MKCFVLSLIAVLFLFSAGSGRAQTTNVYWSFTGEAVPDNAATITGLSTAFSYGNAPSLKYDNSLSSLSSGYTTAAGYAASSGNYAVLTDRAGAFDPGANSYFSFDLSLSTAAGVSYAITDVSLGSRSTGTGPTLLSLYASTTGDNFASLGSVNVSEDKTWAAVDFSDFSLALPDDGSTVYFRLYGTTPAASVGNSNWQIEDLAAIIVTAPEPSGAALAILGGMVCLAVLFRRR
jgi:hypothetical protein